MASIHECLAHLAAPERTRLLLLLSQQELAVGELARVVQMSQPAVSRHLKALEDDGWVMARRDGTARLFALRDELTAEQAQLWEIVRVAIVEPFAEDQLRLSSVLAARSSNARFFGEMAGQWSEVRKELYGSDFLLPTLLSLLPPQLDVADLGCGTGDVLRMLAPHICHGIGIDREPAMLIEARQKMCGYENIEVCEGSLEKLPIQDRSVDVALLMLVLHHIEQPGLVIQEASRILKRDGRVIVLDMIAHDRESYRRQMGHIHLGFHREQIEQYAVGAGFLFHRYTILPPDPKGSGPALFLAILGKKEAYL